MKKIIILLVLFILFFCPNVFAAEFNMNNYTSATLNGTKNRYQGTEIYEVGGNFTYQFGTRYNGRLSEIETFFDYPFVEGLTYRFTYNMATNDFNNNFGSSYWWDCDHSMTNQNAHVFIPTYISYKKIQYSITPDADTSCIRVSVRGKNLSTGNITQIKNWALSSITIYDPEFQSGSGGNQGTSPAPTPTPNSNQDIINNQNNNTQDIINNNNENTENIITSIQETTGQVSEAITNAFSNRCSNLFNNRDYYHMENNPLIREVDDEKIVLTSDYTWSWVGYEIPVEIGKTYYFNGSVVSTNLSTTGMIWLGTSDNPTQYYQWENIGTFSTSFTATSNKIYLRLYATKGILPNSNYYYQVMLSEHNTIYCPFGSTTSNKLDDVNNSINDLNDTMKDDNIDNGLGGSFFSDFDDQDFGLSSIITIPLNTIQSLTSRSCVALNVPIPFTNSSVPLPCMTEVYQQNIPTIYNLWKVVSFGIIAYFIAIDIFHMVKGFKDPESDKVEVLDL